MTAPSTRAARRAATLVRWYPKSWRARYGDEFVALLMADLTDRPHSWRRGADVARTGLSTRLSATGLGRPTLPPVDQIRCSMAAVVSAVAVFLAFAVAMWAQLTVGWQWSQPDAAATKAAVVVITSGMALFAALALLAAVPVVWAVLVGIVRRRQPGLVGPSALFVVGTVLVIVGSRHFGNGWPGTGGHAWAGQGLVPGGVAAFSWASTLSISSYWAHPGALASFPLAELGWMALSPLAIAGVVVGATKTVRRLELSPRAWRYEAGLARAAAMGMLIVLGACGGWLVDGGPGPRNLFHAGAIDIVAVGVMAAALAVAYRAVSKAGRSRLRLPTG